MTNTNGTPVAKIETKKPPTVREIGQLEIDEQQKQKLVQSQLAQIISRTLARERMNMISAAVAWDFHFMEDVIGLQGAFLLQANDMLAGASVEVQSLQAENTMLREKLAEKKIEVASESEMRSAIRAMRGGK